MELEAAAAVEQPTDAAVHAREATQAELTAATAAHATMKEHYDEAEKTLKQKKQAKKEAGAERDRLHKLKKTAVPEARALAIYEWKDALSAEKAADEAVKMAKDARREADSARLKAWKRVQEARKAAEENSRAANMATAEEFLQSYRQTISAPRQASEGLKPWSKDAPVTHVKIDDSKLPPLDGKDVQDVKGNTVRFEPPLGGATVLVAGTGGMKTRCAYGFVAKHKNLPMLMITSRINMAHKFEADLKGLEVDVHNYALINPYEPCKIRPREQTSK